jgi:hypothetical protein
LPDLEIRKWLRWDDRTIRSITMHQDMVALELDGGLLALDLSAENWTKYIKIPPELSGRILPLGTKVGKDLTLKFLIKSPEGVQLLTEADIMRVASAAAAQVPEVKLFQSWQLAPRDQLVFTYVEGSRLNIVKYGGELLHQKTFPTILKVACCPARILILTCGGRHIYCLDWAPLLTDGVHGSVDQVPALCSKAATDEESSSQEQDRSALLLRGGASRPAILEVCLTHQIWGFL